MRQCALWFAIVWALAGTATAQPGPPGDARLLDRIQVTGTRRAESTFDVPVSVTVIGQEQVSAAAAQTAMDLLHGEPGTFVQQTTPGQAVVIVRGLKGSEVLHLVDGFRLNTAFFRNAPNQYMALVDGQMLERVEVVRGPSGTLYGSDAMGGVVQLLSPSARFTNGAFESEGHLRGMYASADDSLVTRLAARGGTDRVWFTAGVTYQDVNELRVGGGEELPFTAFIARAGDAKAVFKVGDRSELTLQFQTLEQPKTPRHDELVPGFGQTRPNSATFFFEPQGRDFAQVRWQWDADVPTFDTAVFQLGWQMITDDRRSRDFGSNNEEQERNSSELFGLGAQLSKALGDHLLTYGVELYEDEISSFRQRLNISTGAISARPSRFPDGSTMDTVSVYIADDFRANEVLDFYGGLRWSRSEVELPATIGGIGVDISPSDWSGHFGVRYSLTDTLNFVSNYGRGFRAPNVFDLGTFGDRPSNRFNIPNPDLESESVDTIDAGFKWASDAIEAEFIGYVSRYQDKITAVLTGDVTDTGRLVTQSRNVTELDLWGFEGGLRWFFSEGVETYATATYTRGDEEFDGDTFAADRIPPLYGKLGALWRTGPWTLEAYSHYATRQDRLSPRDRIDPRINPDGTAGWATLGARAAYTFSNSFTVSLRAANLADKRYREHGTGLDEPGRNLVLTVDWRPGR